jgi:hypothetical protein
MSTSQRLSSDEQSSHVLKQWLIVRLTSYHIWCIAAVVDERFVVAIGSPTDLAVSLAHVNRRIREALSRSPRCSDGGFCGVFSLGERGSDDDA